MLIQGVRVFPALLQVERLSDNRQEVRQAACNLMLEVLQVRRVGVHKVQQNPIQKPERSKEYM